VRDASAVAFPPAIASRRLEARGLAWALPVGLFMATLALYAATRSISLDDFDSFNFARAIDHFDLRLNQPQPPGYPVYVMLARAFDLALRDHQTALTLLSAVSGAAAVGAFLALAAEVGAAWAALPLALAPLFWLSAGMALSDVPGLAFATIATFCVVRGSGPPNDGGVDAPNPTDRTNARHGRVKWLLGGCAIAGIGAGVRPQDAIVPLGVLVLYGASRLPVRVLLAGVGVFVLACLAWAAPLAASLGGPADAWGVLAGQSRYVGATDSLFARPLTMPNVEARLAEFGNVFSAYFGGPANGGLAAAVGLAAGLAALTWLASHDRWLALSWLLPYGAFMLLAMRPDDPRKVLPVMPAMLLLVGGLRPRVVAALACSGLAAWFAFSAAPLVTLLDSVKAPPEQAAAFISQTYSPADTLVIAGASYNAIRYRDPAFQAFLIDDLNPGVVQAELASSTYRNLVVLDKEGFNVPDTFVGVDTRTFERDPLVLPKASTVWLAAYRPLADLRDRDLALPPGAVHIGTPDDVSYLTDGWYRPETIAGVPARWADRRAQVRFWVDRPSDATLQLTGVAYPSGQRLTVLLNGEQVADVAMPTDWAPYTISLPAAVFHPQAINIVTLEHSLAASPSTATQGQSLDSRPLAAAYSTFELAWR
jgi:hypothetical protein